VGTNEGMQEKEMIKEKGMKGKMKKKKK